MNFSTIRDKGARRGHVIAPGAHRDEVQVAQLLALKTGEIILHQGIIDLAHPVAPEVEANNRVAALDARNRLAMLILDHIWQNELVGGAAFVCLLDRLYRVGCASLSLAQYQRV